MEMQTSCLKGRALDWAVTKALGIHNVGQPSNIEFDAEWAVMHEAGDMRFSTNWGQGGPVVDERDINIISKTYLGEPERKFLAYREGDALGAGMFGPTKLTAAMRYLVVSEIGHVVDVPAIIATE